MNRYIVTESFGDFEIWRSEILTKEQAYLHANELKNSNKHGDIKVLQYFPANYHLIN